MNLHTLLATLGLYPRAALAVVALTAFAESVAIIGTFVPAALVMFGAGALVASGTLGLWPTLGVATLGAVAGDGLSYELGRSHEARIRAWPFFARKKAALARGEAFVARHGGKSIALARFSGAVRAFVPLLAGFAHMSRLRFYTVNVASALLWAPVHILPGVLFGTSLKVAEAVSGRLALLLVLLVALTWSVLRLASAALRFGAPLLGRWRDGVVARARGRRSAVARAAMALLDPERPESVALLSATLLVIGAGWLFLGVVEDVWSHDPLVQADLAIFGFLQGLRTGPVDRLMVALTGLGGAGVMLSLIVAVAAWLAWRRCWRTAAYWLVVAAVAHGLVQIGKYALARPRPIALYSGIERFSFPSGHTTVTTAVLGFLAFLLMRGQALRAQLAIASGAALYIALVAFSRVYLGAHWMSDVLGGMSLGMTWVALAALVYTQRRVAEPVAPRGLMGVALATLVAASVTWTGARFAHDLRRYALAPAPQQLLTPEQWLAGGWQALPARRHEIAGDPEERFDLQWACGPAQVGRRLGASGWRVAPAWSLRTTLDWLLPATPVQDLALLPRFDRGNRSVLVFVRPVAGLPDARQVLRLWRSDFTLQRATAPGDMPIWYGAIYQETLPRRWLVLPPPRQTSIGAVGAFAAQPPPRTTVRVGTAGSGAAAALLTCEPASPGA